MGYRVVRSVLTLCGVIVLSASVASAASPATYAKAISRLETALTQARAQSGSSKAIKVADLISVDPGLSSDPEVRATLRALEGGSLRGTDFSQPELASLLTQPDARKRLLPDAPPITKRAIAGCVRAVSAVTDPLAGVRESIYEAAPFLKPRRGGVPNEFREDGVSGSGVPLTTGATELDDLYARSGRFFNGTLSRTNAARLANRARRQRGDFRYTYTPETYQAWMRAEQRLADIPKGKFAEAFTPDLVAEINTLAASPDVDTWANKLFYVGAFVRRGFHGPVPGEVRTTRTVTRVYGPFKDAEIEALEESGARLIEVPTSMPDARWGSIEYAQPGSLKGRLTRLVNETRKALLDPSKDPSEIAARWLRRYMALHPMNEWNGRTGRLIMDRLLLERGYAPPILKDTNADMTLTHEELVAEIRAGIARSSANLTKSDLWQTSSGPSYLSGLLSKRNISMRDLKLDFGKRAGDPIRVNAIPFALGPDGFVYDFAGRPYMVGDSGNFEPLSQLTYYMMARRIADSENPLETLAFVTKPTREKFKKVARDPVMLDPDARDFTAFNSDLDAIRADNDYRIVLPSPGSARRRFLSLMDPARVPEAIRFTAFQKAAAPLPASFAMSRYAQRDLELWHVKRALSADRDKVGVALIERYRSQLFAQAKAKLATFATPDKATTENPLGLAATVDRMMFEHSPLRHSSLAEAIAHDGDSTLPLWRGDASIVRWIGIHPDNIPFRADAIDWGKQNQATNGTHNLLQEIDDLSSSARGAPYQSYTTNLSLLTNSSFASKTADNTVSLKALPDAIRTRIETALPTPGELMEVTSLGDLARAPIGQARVVPAGNVDIAGLTDEQIGRVVYDGTFSPEKKQLFEDRVKAARASDGSWRTWLPGAGEKQQLVQVSDLGLHDSSYMQSNISSQRAAATIRRVAGDDPVVRITVHRRAFLINVDKKAALPGRDTLGGSFENEQESHVLEGYFANRIRGEWSVDQLKDVPPPQ